MFLATIFTNLGFARFALMSRHTNLIKDAMKLSDNGGNLRGEIAGIHVERDAGPLKRGGASSTRLSQPSEEKEKNKGTEQRTDAMSSR